MANAPVTGNGPFEFTDTFGRQVSIPLTAFSVDPVLGIVPDSAWAAVFTTSPATAAPASALLSYMIRNSLITAAPAPAPVAAMVIKAADPGAAGNNITVQIVAGASNPDPTLTTFNVIVTEQEIYSGLTTATIAGVIGTCDASGNPLTAGSTPGLVRVLQGSDSGLGSPSAVTGLLSGNPAQIEVDGTGSPALAFTLVARKAGADANLTKVQVIPDVTSPQTGPETFGLIVSWQKEVDDVSISTLQSEAQTELGYEITVATPVSGAFSAPAASTATLSGGGPGVNASATIFTGA